MSEKTFECETDPFPATLARATAIENTNCDVSRLDDETKFRIDSALACIRSAARRGHRSMRTWPNEQIARHLEDMGYALVRGHDPDGKVWMDVIW